MGNRRHLKTLRMLCAIGGMFLSGCVQPLQLSPGHTEVGAGGAEVPIALPFQGMPAFELQEVHSPTKPLVAVLDTGATTNLITPDVVEQNRFPIAYSSVRIVDAGGKSRERVRIARVSGVKIGNATFEQFDAVIDDAQMLPGFNSKINMLVGLPVFKDVLLTIDYPHQTLRLENGELPPANGRDILPLRRTEQGHLLMPIQVGGSETWVTIDTGFTGRGLLLSRYELLTTKWASQPVEIGSASTLLGNVQMRVGRMDGDIKLGETVVHRPMIGITPVEDSDILGADLLQDFVVTIDQKNNRIRLRTPLSSPIEVRPIRQLGFALAGQSHLIRVSPASQAAAIGLKDGDELISINGIELEQLTVTQVYRIEQAGRSMILRVRRGGEEKTFLVPVTTLVP